MLAAALPDGFAADPATLRLDLEPGVGDGAFVVTARATGRVQLDPAALAAQLAGQRLGDVTAALNALPLAEPPRLDVGPSWWRAWFGRLPLRAERIQVELLP